MSQMYLIDGILIRMSFLTELYRKVGCKIEPHIFQLQIIVKLFLFNWLEFQV